MRIDQLECFLRISSGDNAVALVYQQQHGDLAQAGIIVDHKDQPFDWSGHEAGLLQIDS